MNMPATIFIAIGAVLAAIISGFFAFVNLVASKDQKTSEFRQDWINKLREDLTNFTASSASISSMFMHFASVKDEQQKEIQITEFLNNNIDLLDSIIKNYDSIRLRVNPKDDKEILEKLNKLYMLIENPRVLKSEQEVTEASNELITEAQTLLKKEWNRVKRGEPAFWIAKWLSLAIFSVSLVLIFYKYDSIVAFLSISVNGIAPNK